MSHRTELVKMLSKTSNILICLTFEKKTNSCVRSVTLTNDFRLFLFAVELGINCSVKDVLEDLHFDYAGFGPWWWSSGQRPRLLL